MLGRREAILAGMATFMAARARAGAAPRDAIRVVAESGPNSRDPMGAGVSSPSLGAFTNVYDRLINFAHSAVAPGVFRYDYSRFVGELAESYEVGNGGKALLFALRPGAVFHDGTRVTAADVKWSLDRAVSLPGSKHQLATGSMTDPGQFVVLDEGRLRIDLPRPDRYALPNLALTFASVVNATLARGHATEADPWAAQWLRDNAAGGGAYRVGTWEAGQSVEYLRFDDWRSGTLPALRRAVVQVVPQPPSRVAALLKGDADIALQLPPKDLDSLAHDARARVLSVTVSNAFRFLAFNTRMAPFSDVRARQAIANALPYEAIFQAAAYGHGTPLFGATSATPASDAYPQPYPYATDLSRARALLAQAGLKDGFSTTFSFNVGDATVAEPIALLVQEALAPLGIAVEIEKVPAADWGTRLTAHAVPFFVDRSLAWFDDPDYFFRIFFQGDWRWNFGAFQSPELAKLLDAVRWETDAARYDAAMRAAVEIAFRELPILPLWAPTFEAGINPALTDFVYYIHGEVDFRPLRWS